MPVADNYVTNMKMRKLTLAISLLAALTIGGLFTLYQICFDIWMTAYPPEAPNLSYWRKLLAIRLATAAVIALLWVIAAIWLFRDKRRAKSDAS